MLRISLDSEQEWMQQRRFPFSIGGAELNVASALARWGVPVGYVTALPENELVKPILATVASRGVDVSPVLTMGDKVGLYYLSAGKDLKSAAVIYDREGSSFSKLRKGMLNWDALFKEVSFFHFSAICPALNQHSAAVCEEALHEAQKRNIKVSIDLNYRNQLWNYVDSPHQVMSILLSSCALVMGNVWAANALLGIPLDQQALAKESKAGFQEAALACSLNLMEKFPNCELVANTFRFKTESQLQYYSCLYAQGELYTSKEYVAKQVVDMVGSGDCYMAGLLYGTYHSFSFQKTIDFATAAAFSKLFIREDATNLGVQEVIEFVKPYESSPTHP